MVPVLERTSPQCAWWYFPPVLVLVTSRGNTACVVDGCGGGKTDHTSRMTATTPRTAKANITIAVTMITAVTPVVGIAATAHG